LIFPLPSVILLAMELLCPQCQQRLTIPDQYAGQVMRCPLCNGTFTAPALTASAPPPPPPLPVLAPEFVSAEPPLQFAEPPRQSRDTGLKPGPPPVPPAAPPPPPPGDYTHTFKIWISPKVVPWIVPVGLFLVFLLTLFPWFHIIEEFSVGTANAWGLGFGHSDALIGVYLIFLLLALIAAVPSALISLRLIPAPPFVQQLGKWRPVIVGGIALFAFLLFFMRYLNILFAAAPATIWLRLAFWIHFVVVIALLLEVWLEFRRLKNLPLPRIDLHW
jgi:hypothetical protein